MQIFLVKAAAAYDFLSRIAPKSCCRLLVESFGAPVTDRCETQTWISGWSGRFGAAAPTRRRQKLLLWMRAAIAGQIRKNPLSRA
jgi:hypothetical protein